MGAKWLRHQKRSYFGWVMQEIHSELSRNESCSVWLAQKIDAWRQQMLPRTHATLSKYLSWVMRHRYSCVAPSCVEAGQMVGLATNIPKPLNNLCTTRYNGRIRARFFTWKIGKVQSKTTVTTTVTTALQLTMLEKLSPEQWKVSMQVLFGRTVGFIF